MFTFSLGPGCLSLLLTAKYALKAEFPAPVSFLHCTLRFIERSIANQKEGQECLDIISIYMDR